MSRLDVPERLPGIVDAHAHLQHEVFAYDLDAVLERARAAGVTRILVPGWDRPSSEAALELAVHHPDLLDVAVGIHPHYVAAATEVDWAVIEDLAADPAVLAVGETGLDYHRNLSPPPTQRAGLERHLALAARVGKPVVVHDREAHEDVSGALRAHARVMSGSRHASLGLLHAFSGDAAMAAALSEAGYLVSFALPVTFPKNSGPREAAASLPSGSFLVETDSPYLGLAPDQRNEPTTVLRTAAVIALLRGVDPAQVAASAAEGYRHL